MKKIHIVAIALIIIGLVFAPKFFQSLEKDGEYISNKKSIELKYSGYNDEVVGGLYAIDGIKNAKSDNILIYVKTKADIDFNEYDEKQTKINKTGKFKSSLIRDEEQNIKEIRFEQL